MVIDHPAAPHHAIAVNLGLGGVFVEASPTLGYGERIELVLQLPGLAGPSRLPGVVRWVDATGFGVQFQQLGARETHAIGELVAAFRHTATSSPGQPSLPETNNTLPRHG